MAAKRLKGTVEAYNYSPKGKVEGLLVRTDSSVAQVNFPPHAEAERFAVGSAIDVAVEPEEGGPKHDRAAHPVYHAIDEDDERIEGNVVRLNYTRHGEANGVVLDTGDFVHLKPHGMRAAALAIGDHVCAEGSIRPMLTGGRAVEAETVNGVPVAAKP